MHQNRFEQLFNTRIAMADDVFRWMDKMAKVESGGNLKIGLDYKKDIDQMLNNVKANLLGGTMEMEERLLKTYCYEDHIKGKTVQFDISYYATPFYINYSLIYLRNNNSKPTKESKASQCRDLVFVDIVKGSPKRIKSFKTNHKFDRSSTKPFYQLSQA
jgi:hypothetical protein